MTADDPRPVGADDLPNLTALLVDAFDDDAIIHWFVRQDHRRAAAASEFFDVVLRRFTVPHGRCTRLDHAVALVVPGDRWQLGPLTRLAIAPSILRAGGWWRAHLILRAFDAMERAHPREPHLYLSFLAVRPGHQGQGLGARLLRPYLDEADRGGLGMYLENTKAQNLPFYRRHGFEVTSMIDLGSPGPPYWAMWRPPEPRCAT
jgi:GNAT superfamily N-acetyltransferase